jgi:DNA polymerase III gamma/tau subunit
VALDAIRDQPRAVALLRRALETDRVAHAYAFVGPAGAGRMTTALAFAQSLLCCNESRGAGTFGGWPETRRDPAAFGLPPSIPPEGRGAPCGVCHGCRLAGLRQHPDLHVIVPTPPETNPRGARAIRIDAIRGLERQAALRPVMARRKLFVLDEAERMTGEAPEAFLKTLEEPPAGTVMILVLPRARALPATVISRCQIVRFEPRGGESASALHAQARALLAEVRAEGAEAMFRRTERLDREMAEGLVDAYWLLCRDLVLAKASVPASLLADGPRALELAREAETWTLDDLLRAIELCRRAREALAHNVAPRLTVEVILSRLALRAA